MVTSITTTVFTFSFWVMCNIIILRGTKKDATQKNKTIYEEWWEGSDAATHVVMTIFFPIVSIVALLSWKSKR